MRTIKFRIFDKGRSEWVHDTEHAINILGEAILFGEVLRRPDDTSVSLSELNDLVVMQFTGLTDKNGKEIYEGDLIKHKACHISEVVFKNGMFIYRHLHYDFSGKQSGLYEQPIGFLEDVGEVVSNIYEQPVDNSERNLENIQNKA